MIPTLNAPMSVLAAANATDQFALAGGGPALPFTPPPGLDAPSPRPQLKRTGVTWGFADVCEFGVSSAGTCEAIVPCKDAVHKPLPTLLRSQRPNQAHGKDVASHMYCHNSYDDAVQPKIMNIAEPFEGVDLPLDYTHGFSKAMQVPPLGSRAPYQPGYLEPDLTFMQMSQPNISAMPADGELTTVMLQNLPSCYERSMLLNLLDVHGFHGQYDFVYLPLDFKSGLCLGYAFVNFVSHGLSLRAFDAFTGLQNWGCSTNKVCDVIWRTKHQGLHKNVEVMRNSTVMHPEIPECFQPALFVNGVRVPFPPPTKRISVARTVINSSKKCVMVQA